MPADVKPYRHRCPRSIIQHAVWLYHRFTLSYRDIEELLLQRGIEDLLRSKEHKGKQRCPPLSWCQVRLACLKLLS